MTFVYQPFPGSVTVKYGTDTAGTHIQYNQTPGVATQLATEIVIANPDGSSTTVNGTVDPLPTSFHTDIYTTPTGGSIAVALTPAQRKPDASFNLVSLPDPGGGPPLVVAADMAAIPSSMDANWSTQAGQPAGSFDASDGGLGAVDLTYHNYTGTSLVLPAFVPNQQQYVSYQSVPNGPFGTNTAISAALQGVHHLDFAVTPTGIVTHTNIGTGTAPLQVHYLADSRAGSAGSLLSANGTISPLPSQLDVAFSSPGGSAPVEVATDNNATGNVTVAATVAPPPPASPSAVAPPRTCAPTPPSPTCPPSSMSRPATSTASAKASTSTTPPRWASPPPT